MGDLIQGVVPGERIELPTNGLQNRCSTAELTRLVNDKITAPHAAATSRRSALSTTMGVSQSCRCGGAAQRLVTIATQSAV
jgi:hypothetical protein